MLKKSFQAFEKVKQSLKICRQARDSIFQRLNKNNERRNVS